MDFDSLDERGYTVKRDQWEAQKQLGKPRNADFYKNLKANREESDSEPFNPWKPQSQIQKDKEKYYFFKIEEEKEEKTLDCLEKLDLDDFRYDYGPYKYNKLKEKHFVTHLKTKEVLSYERWSVNDEQDIRTALNYLWQEFVGLNIGPGLKEN